MAAVPSGFDSIDDTLPTWTPRIFTLASGFITRPARSEITVTGIVAVKLPRKRLTARATIAAIATTVPSPASGRIYPCAPKWRPGRAATDVAALVVSDRCNGP